MSVPIKSLADALKELEQERQLAITSIENRYTLLKSQLETFAETVAEIDQKILELSAIDFFQVKDIQIHNEFSSVELEVDNQRFRLIELNQKRSKKYRFILLVKELK